jgi:hypothetical protein
VLLIAVSAVSFAAGEGAGKTSKTPAPAAAAPPASSPAAHPSAAAAPAAPPKAAAKPAAGPVVLATFNGSGTERTAQFTVPGSGNWELKWSYNCASAGGQGNFIVDEDGDNNPNGVNVNELGNGSSGATHAYSDAGRHYLDVNSECNWTMSAVSQP